MHDYPALCLCRMYSVTYLESNVLAALLASVTLLFEPMGRQSEITLYALNKGMELTHQMLARRGWPVRVPGGEALLVTVAMAAICFHYLLDPDIIKGNYRAVLDKLLKNI